MNPKLSKFLAFLLSLAMLISNVPASAITVTAVGSDEINSVAESADNNLYVNCDYNASTEGYGVSKFSNYAGAYAYATANGKTSATIVVEKTNTLSGNTFDNNHKNYSKLAVVIKDGATMGNAASKWDMTYPVTVEPGGTLTCARPKNASVSNIHIKNTLTVGAVGAEKKAVVDFLSDDYQDCDISIRYNGKVIVNNADFFVQDLDAQGTLTINDSVVTVDGAFASATFYKTTLTNTNMTIKGTQISGGLSDFAGGTANQLGNVTINNSTLTIKDGTTKVASNVTVNGASTLAVENMTINSGKKITVNDTASIEVAGELTNNGTIAASKDATVSAETVSDASTGKVTIGGVEADLGSNGQFGLSVAKIGEKGYESLAAAIAAAQAGQTITFIADINENVTIDKALTIDGAKFTYTGEMTLTADTTIKNVNFDGQGYNGYAVTTRGAQYVTIDGCTAKNYGYGFVQLASATALTTVKNITVSNMNYGVKVDYSGAVVLENADITVGVAAVLNSNYGEKTITIKNSKLNILGTWTRNNTTKTTYVFKGANTIDSFIIDAAIDNFKLEVGATLTAPNDITATATEAGYTVKYEDGKYVVKGNKVAIGEETYASLADAIAAAQAGQTITFIADINENVTIDKALTIDGAKFTYTGEMTLTADTTIKNVNFDGQGYNGYAVTTRGAQYVTIDGCTAKNYGYGFVQLASGTTLTTVKDVTVSDMNYGVKVDYSNAVVLENVDITVGVAAVLNSNYGEKTITIKNSKLNILGTWDRNDTIKTTYVFEGANTIDKFIVVAAIDNFKLAAGATLTAPNDITVTTDVTGGYVEYEDGKYFVMMGLKGEGTKENPYLIGSVNDLIMFRDSVNAGETKYSAPGVYVVLTADIDLEGINWVGIGSAYIDHGFMGNFDGNGYKIKNLTITNPAVDSDGYAYAGLFAVTEGTDKNNQNFIKNLTIENVTISTTGHIVAAAIAYPYYTIVENVTVCGDIKIEGGNYTAGALAYTRRCVDASNVTVSGNAGSYIKGAQTVGGVISDIQMNGGLIANYSNFSASGLTISGTKQVGGIAGIIGAQTLNGATVKNVTIDCADAREGIIAGSLGGISTITNATYESVTGATAEVGADYDTGKPIEAKLGDKYYKTFAAAYAAAKADDTITLLVDMSLSQILVIDKAITLNGNGHKLTSTAGRAINVSGANGVTIKNLTINCTGERAINIIQNATNVTIENVTATAKNYTVNVAASAPNAVVTINDSTLNGLCTVNVSAEGAEVAIDKSIINCNDNNATVGESYAALSLNKDGKGGSIVATDTTVNVTEGSDSTKGRNGAENGTVAINGSTEDVVIMVAAITYAGSDNYHAFQTLESAIEFAKAGDTITLIRDIAISEGITNTKKITLDLNGKTITGTDNATASFAIITNKGELTITGNGKITLKATNNRGWSAYSSIISNTVGGKLIVVNGTIEHLGGTDMAYAIDNLTNGKGTKAETVINGGTVKSTYRAIRMFLNGVEAQNILTINGGVVEGANKSVWMQDANKNLNPGKLTVTEDATLKGDVYLTVTAGSAEWPVEVAIAASAVNGQVLTSNAPAGYALLNTNGVWGVDKYTAKVGEQHFKTLQEAIANANDGDTITLLTDVALENTVLSLSKDITLDLNGCTISGHFTNKTTQFVSIEAGAEVVINDASGKGGIKATSVEGTLSNLIRAQEGSKLTINGGNYTQDFSVEGAGMIDTRGDECITINKGTFVLGNVGTLKNGSPWIFNGAGQNTKNIIVNGGSFTTDVAHQYWPFEVSMDYTKALKKENGMYTVVDAVAYVTEAEWSGRWYYNFVGYATLEEAIAACQGPQSYIYYGKKYTSEQEQVVLLENIELTDSLVIAADKSVVLDLNGFTISQTKECTGSYSMIENKGKLVIVDEWGGKISFTDTGKGDPNFGWGTYTIRNEGTLEINGGYIEHNGSNQAFATHCAQALFQYSGSTVINGGVFDSNYRSVRLWKGDMTINGGKFVGQVWVQAVDNSASLTINDGKFQPVGGDKSSVFVTNSQYDVAFAVNGGTFASKIGVSVASKLTGCIANTGVIIIGTGTDEVLFAK